MHGAVSTRQTHICSNFPIDLNQFALLGQRNALYPLQMNRYITQEMGKQPTNRSVPLLGKTLSS